MSVTGLGRLDEVSSTPAVEPMPEVKEIGYDEGEPERDSSYQLWMASLAILAIVVLGHWWWTGHLGWN